MKRGELWWVGLGEPTGSVAGYRRPMLIVSSNKINNSELKTLLTVPLTSNLSREHFEMSVRIPAQGTGLKNPSVAVLNLVTSTNKQLLVDRIGRLPDDVMNKIDQGLRLVLAL